MSGEIFSGPYGKMDFGTYTFQEFPKMVGTGKNGEPIFVNSKAEEEAFLAAPPETVVPSVPTELAQAKFENDQLRERLAALEAAQAKAIEAKAPKADAPNPLAKS